MPGIDFDAVREQITIVEVLDQLHFVPVAKSGSQWRGPCPVHGSTEGSRSFSVNVATGRYFCHKCGSRGNQLELWASVQDLPLFEAASDLCKALNKEIPWIKNG